MDLELISPRDMTLAELDAAYSHIEQQRREALAADVPHDRRARIESDAVRVTNELRRRGL